MTIDDAPSVTVAGGGTMPGRPARGRTASHRAQNRLGWFAVGFVLGSVYIAAWLFVALRWGQANDAGLGALLAGGLSAWVIGRRWPGGLPFALLGAWLSFALSMAWLLIEFWRNFTF
jgi:hypothetical protein